MAQARRLILAGDIGATSSRLALYEAADGRLALRAEETSPSRAHAGLEPIAAAFVERAGLRPDLACLGVPGPVQGGRAEPVNLPWVVDGASLARQLGVSTVHLLNDLEAAAWGVPLLGPGDLLVLNEGAPGARGNAAVIAAGTGLGQAGLYWDGAMHRPFATEGGHVDFAPRNALEAELLHYLLARFPRVSYERVLSGPGLCHIYAFLRDSGRGRECASVVRAMERGDPAAAIAEAALDGSCALCGQALDLFVSLYGAQAGNLALALLATGGVYVGGGIAPKIRARLTGPAFMAAFTAKGRFADELRAVPVRVILDPRVALRGAARYATLAAGPA